MYTVVRKLSVADTKKNGGEPFFYLNHAHLGSMEFGSRDMAWSNEDYHVAWSMLNKCIDKHKGKRYRLGIEEL